MDVKLLHPVWKDFLDTVNTVVLTGYWKQLIIFLFDIQCMFQSGSECGPWTKIIGNSCLVIRKIHLDFLWFFYLQCKSMVEYILVCPLRGSAGRVCHLENVIFCMSYLQQSTKIMKILPCKPILAFFFKIESTHSICDHQISNWCREIFKYNTVNLLILFILNHYICLSAFIAMTNFIR